MDIWYSSWYFGIFFPFWYFVPRKIWQPCIVPQSEDFKHFTTPFSELMGGRQPGRPDLAKFRYLGKYVYMYVKITQNQYKEGLIFDNLLANRHHSVKNTPL
jgi:hypothetical protein